MKLQQAPQCAQNQFHKVIRLAELPTQVLEIANHQGAPTIWTAKPEDPPWWCVQCGLHVNVAAKP